MITINIRHACIECWPFHLSPIGRSVLQFYFPGNHSASFLTLLCFFASCTTTLHLTSHSTVPLNVWLSNFFRIRRDLVYPSFYIFLSVCSLLIWDSVIFFINFPGGLPFKCSNRLRIRAFKYLIIFSRRNSHLFLGSSDFYILYQLSVVLYFFLVQLSRT